jgi:hypothetical protein
MQEQRGGRSGGRIAACRSFLWLRADQPTVDRVEVVVEGLRQRRRWCSGQAHYCARVLSRVHGSRAGGRDGRLARATRRGHRRASGELRRVWPDRIAARAPRVVPHSPSGVRADEHVIGARRACDHVAGSVRVAQPEDEAGKRSGFPGRERAPGTGEGVVRQSGIGAGRAAHVERCLANHGTPWPRRWEHTRQLVHWRGPSSAGDRRTATSGAANASATVTARWVWAPGGAPDSASDATVAAAASEVHCAADRPCQ